MYKVEVFNFMLNIRYRSVFLIARPLGKTPFSLIQGSLNYCIY